MSALTLRACFVTVFGTMPLLQAAKAEMILASCFDTFAHGQLLVLEASFNAVASNVTEQTRRLLGLLSR